MIMIIGNSNANIQLSPYLVNRNPQSNQESMNKPRF